jgi:hypothetical protein
VRDLGHDDGNRPEPGRCSRKASLRQCQNPSVTDDPLTGQRTCREYSSAALTEP